ncbi:MAG: cofactor-independent phosphoglycerate mutase [Peptostreptococcaceae bacterium]|nr:cofactor-independent phosphoglycerate mutase [Peptostreptococcaceae bacterium]
MRYLIVVPDGAGDEPIAKLEGRTPLQTANMPCANGLAKLGLVGMVKTIPEGIAPGSDAANLSVMGYDPAKFLTGRSPLEAASIGIEMLDTDVAFRVNLITLTGDGEYEDMRITDHSSGDISTEEADRLIKAVQDKFGNEKIKFYTGVSYRHCMIVKDGETSYDLTPPHDVLTRRAGDYLPKGEGSEFITRMMKESYELLKNHPVNIERMNKGLNPANTIWIWGQGKKPALTSFYDKYKIRGTAISAVDLIKGIALCAGLNSVDVAGATGTLHTNFEGKTKAAINEFEAGKDFVYLHLEAPDECSHQGDLDGKIKSLEIIDEKVIKPLVEYFRSIDEDFRVLIVPDHRTPLALRTHTSDPVPFVLYNSKGQGIVNQANSFDEVSGAKGMYFDSGFSLANYFFAR